MCKRIFLTLVLAALPISTSQGENWPQWRGPNLNGVSSEKNLPLRWSTTENIAWQLALPSWSGSTPIIWGDRIFLNVADGNDLYLWCVEKAKGIVLWKKHLGGGNVKVGKQNMSSP
ncbi:MAG: pyrrolo-quinoline quinone, partial [Acidobacteria bacterium]